MPKVSNLTINCGDVGGGDPTDTPVATDTPGPTGEATDTPVPTDTPEPTATSTPSPQLCGDVDGDGVVNSLDALRILFVVADLTDVLPVPENADVNGDDVVDAVDAGLILQKEAGLIGQDALTC